MLKFFGLRHKKVKEAKSDQNKIKPLAYSEQKNNYICAFVSSTTLLLEKQKLLGLLRFNL